MPVAKLSRILLPIAIVVVALPSAAIAKKPALAKTFEVSPKRFTPVSTPQVKVRVNRKGAKTLKATLVFKPRSTGKRTSVNLGTIAANRTNAVPLRATKIKPGRYSVRIAVAQDGHVPLQRTRRSPGVATVVVDAAPAAPVAPVTTGPITPGVFPVAGAHTFGGPDARFGTGRPGHIHEGQDVVAAQGTPIVAPVSGTIESVDYQASAAGYYIVMDALDGRAFFMAHLMKDSIAVLPGQPVTQGQPLAKVGATGNASGPHLHFEIWLNGWRKTAASVPIDPLPQLLAWGG